MLYCSNTVSQGREDDNNAISYCDGLYFISLPALKKIQYDLKTSHVEAATCQFLKFVVIVTMTLGYPV